MMANGRGPTEFFAADPNAGGTLQLNMSSGAYSTLSATDKPMKVTDLDQSSQAASWIKKPLYYTHHRKPKHEQLSQVIRLPPMHKNIQFTASENASWDGMSENAFQASQKSPGKRLTIVVLLYCGPCNPFHLGDVDVLKRARVSLDALDGVAVVGALVVPFSDETLRERGTPEDRRLPFALRRDLTRNVLQSAQQDSWVVVDTCLGTADDQSRPEGCMQHVAGSIAPFVSVYARGRLYKRDHDIRVLEVRAEDPIEGARAGQPFDQLHVSPTKATSSPRHGPDGQKPMLNSVGTVIVDMPKQSQCDDLIWCAVKQPQDRQLFQAIERFVGTSGARTIQDWSNKRRVPGKSKMLG